jgi:4-hydroxy-2-oxoheptanedioate aldolase
MIDLASDVVGGWLHVPSPVTAELMGTVGFDFMCIDQQHGMIGDDALLPMLQALEATRTPTVVRVTANEPATIGRVLDRGAAGVIVPLVNSPEEAAAAVAACRYPPRGHRSYGPNRAAWLADRPEPLCVVMVETAAAVDALPRMLEVDGIDGIFVGPSDLGLSAGLGRRAQDGDPAFDELLRTIIDACRDRGTPVGIYCSSAEHVQRFRAMGCTFFTLLGDTTLLRMAAREHLERSRREVPPYTG